MLAKQEFEMTTRRTWRNWSFALPAPRALVALAAGALLSGCAALPGMRIDDRSAWFPETEPAAEALEYKLVPITPALIRAQPRPDSAADAEQALGTAATDYVYRIQPHDVLTIIVWDHPELTIPAGEFRSGEESGRLVRNDGTIFFPYAGVVPVAGLTVDEVRRLLADRLDRVIQNPQVDVRVAAYRGHRAYVTGQVQQPGVLPLTDVPLTVLDAVNSVGGFAEQADRRVAYLTRDGVRHVIDLAALYQRGDLRQNFVLQHGDVLNIPDNQDSKVFVLGEVGQQSPVYPGVRGLTLAEALAQAEGIDLTTADTTGVYVVRGTLEANAPVTVYRLDASNATAMILADSFQLQPRDVVFVSTAPLARWNRVVDQILPTVQTLWQTRQLTR